MALFRSFWHGESLPPYQKLCLKSFVDHGHEFVLYSYDHFDVPAGVELKDATEFFPRERVFFYSSGPGAGSVSAFSNLFRYRVLRDCGGWWADADVVCLGRDLPAADIVLGWEVQSRASVGTAILKFPRAHHFVSELYDAAEKLGTNVKWGQAGPDLVTQLVRRHSLESLVIDPSLAYPLAPREALQVLIPAYRKVVQEKSSRAMFLHLWGSILKMGAVVDSIAPPRGSFLAELFEKHGVTFDTGLVYSEDQIRKLSDNFAGNLKSSDAEAASAAHRAEIEYLKGELERQHQHFEGELERQHQHFEGELNRQRDYFEGELRNERIAAESAIADRDAHRRFIQRLTSSTLWRMSWPLRALARQYRKARDRH